MPLPEHPQQQPLEQTPEHPGGQPGRLAAVAVVEVLQRAGHVAYLAGGCVRDELLGLTAQDWDVATDATPDRVRALFKVSRFVGQAFGVVLVRLKRHWIEVATFRTEGVYLDGRHPSEVAFANAERDARRRDFTINGLFEDPLEPDPARRIKDWVGGMNDLHRHVIRAIGDPEARFSEDYLRMLRAVRFASRLGFRIEARTRGAIIARASCLSQISRERIGQEVQWALIGPRPALAVWWIERLGLASPVLTETDAAAGFLGRGRLAGRLVQYVDRANDDHHGYPALLVAWLLERHLLSPLRTVSAEHCSESVRIFVSQHAKAIVERWRAALCLTNVHTDALLQALELLPIILAWPTLTMARKKHLLAEANWDHALNVFRALGRFGRARASRPAEQGAWKWWGGWEEIRRQVEQEMPGLVAQGVAPPPLVTGDDLLEAGWSAGPAMGRILRQIYDAQLEGVIKTKEQALAWANQNRP